MRAPLEIRPDSARARPRRVSRPREKAAEPRDGLAATLDSSPRQLQLKARAERLNEGRAALRSPAPVQKAPGSKGLPEKLKAGTEALSGVALDDVRVHYNSPEPAGLGALAYTKGSEIHVAPGQERHLPHEAWHVVQQKQGRVRPGRQLKGKAVNEDQGLEREADVQGALAARAASAEAVSAVGASSPRAARPVIQKLDDANGVAVTVQRIGVENDVPTLQTWKRDAAWDEDDLVTAIDQRIAALNALAEAARAAAAALAAQQELEALVGALAHYNDGINTAMKAANVPKHLRAAFFANAGATPVAIHQAIIAAGTSALSRKMGIIAFAEGAPQADAVNLAARYETVMGWRMATINVGQLVTYLGDGMLQVVKDTYKDDTLGAGTVYVFKFARLHKRVLPEWHVHWGPRNAISAASFKNNRKAHGEGARVASTSSENGALKAALSAVWGP